MNLKALITTFVLGSSSVVSSAVAMAHPVSAPVSAPIVRDHRVLADADCDHTVAPAPAPAPIYQPTSLPIYSRPMPPQYAPGYEPTVYQPPYHQRAAWATLGGVNQIADGAMTFRVGRFGEQFSTLRLQSDAGKSLIQRVLIRFADGRTQVVEVNQYLNASNPMITIDLDGRARQIAKVTVIGRNARQSAYRVLAI